MTRTEIAWTRAASQPPEPRRPQPIAVSIARETTARTNPALTLSTSRSIAARLPCARSTASTIRASAVFAPFPAARITIRRFRFSVPA